MDRTIFPLVFLAIVASDSDESQSGNRPKFDRHIVATSGMPAGLADTSGSGRDANGLNACSLTCWILAVVAAPGFASSTRSGSVT